MPKLHHLQCRPTIPRPTLYGLLINGLGELSGSCESSTCWTNWTTSFPFPHTKPRIYSSQPCHQDKHPTPQPKHPLSRRLPAQASCSVTRISFPRGHAQECPKLAACRNQGSKCAQLALEPLLPGAGISPARALLGVGLWACGMSHMYLSRLAVSSPWAHRPTMERQQHRATQISSRQTAVRCDSEPYKATRTASPSRAVSGGWGRRWRFVEAMWGSRRDPSSSWILPGRRRGVPITQGRDPCIRQGTHLRGCLRTWHPAMEARPESTVCYLGRPRLPADGGQHMCVWTDARI